MSTLSATATELKVDLRVRRYQYYLLLVLFVTSLGVLLQVLLLQVYEIRVRLPGSNKVLT